MLEDTAAAAAGRCEKEQRVEQEVTPGQEQQQKIIAD